MGYASEKSWQTWNPAKTWETQLAVKTARYIINIAPTRLTQDSWPFVYKTAAKSYKLSVKEH